MVSDPHSPSTHLLEVVEDLVWPPVHSVCVCGGGGGYIHYCLSYDHVNVSHNNYRVKWGNLERRGNLDRACSFCYGEAAQPYLPPLNAQFTETLQTENFTCSLPLTLLLHGRSKLPMCTKLLHFTLQYTLCCNLLFLYIHSGKWLKWLKVQTLLMNTHRTNHHFEKNKNQSSLNLM